MTTVGRGNTCHCARRTVGIGRISIVAILRNDIVLIQFIRETEFSFSVSNPNTQLISRKRTEHHRIVLWYGETKELRLELVRIIMQHTGFLFMIGCKQTQLHHQLAAVANTQTERVGTGIEIIEGFLGFFIPKETTGPTFCRTKYVGIGKTTAINNHIHIFECFATAYQIGHMHVFHIETGKVKRIGHFTITIHAFLSNDRRFYARRLTTVGRNAVLFHLSGKTLTEMIMQRLFFIVEETGLSLSFTALFTIKQI